MSENLVFHPKNPAFSWDHALLFAELADKSYEGVHSIQQYLLAEFQDDLCQETGKSAAQLQAKDIYCREFNGKRYGCMAYLIKLKGAFIIAFRGTEGSKDLRDLITDAKVRLTRSPFSAGRIHRGFLQSYEEINEELLDALYEQESGKEPIWVTGHSLGASVATINVVELTCMDPLLGPRVQGLYTIGQPRTGDDRFVFEYMRHMKGKSFRFVNGNDIVTRVPLPVPHQHPYAHINQRLAFNEETGDLEVGEQFIGKAIEQLQQLFEEVGQSWAKMWDRALDEIGLADHFADQYLPRIREHRQRNTSIQSED